jgi:hypothetical protein
MGFQQFLEGLSLLDTVGFKLKKRSGVGGTKRKSILKNLD